MRFVRGSLVSRSNRGSDERIWSLPEDVGILTEELVLDASEVGGNEETVSRVARRVRSPLLRLFSLTR